MTEKTSDDTELSRFLEIRSSDWLSPIDHPLTERTDVWFLLRLSDGKLRRDFGFWYPLLGFFYGDSTGFLVGYSPAAVAYYRLRYVEPTPELPDSLRESLAR